MLLNWSYKSLKKKLLIDFILIKSAWNFLNVRYLCLQSSAGCLLEWLKIVCDVTILLFRELFPTVYIHCFIFLSFFWIGSMKYLFFFYFLLWKHIFNISFVLYLNTRCGIMTCMNKNHNTICLFRHIWLVTILRI